MPSPDAKSQSRRRAAAAGYEKRDANAKWLFGVVLGLALALLITHFVLSGVLGRMEKTPPPTDPGSAPVKPPSPPNRLRRTCKFLRRPTSKHFAPKKNTI